MLRIALAGGGTGGHIMPNIALIQGLKAKYPGRLELLYFGTRHGMERRMMDDLGVPYRGIFCGKLRRYFSWENFIDIFKIPVGVLQSIWALWRFRPDAVFCKGGYVSLPVAFAAWILRRRVFLHESDVIPGLANQLCSRFATKIFVSFEESRKYFPAKKVVVTGNPVRVEIADGDGNVALKMTGFDSTVPVILFMGGSQGADFINQLVWDNLRNLLPHFQIVHICGKGRIKSEDEILRLNVNIAKTALRRYCQYEFISDDLRHFYALAKVIVTRAGANTLAEIAFIDKPALLIPLSMKASRGDQIVNAETFAKNHRAVVMVEENFDNHAFLAAIRELVESPRARHHKTGKPSTAAETIIHLLTKP